MPNLLESLVPTTELEAVNAMRAVNGDSPVDDLNSPLPVDVEVAVNLIKNVNRAVQSRGWHFNTDVNVTLTPSGGTIATPTDALRVKKSNTTAQRAMDIAHRQALLYDRVANTTTFSGSVDVDIVRLLDFADLPEVARAYIFIVAGRRYQEQNLGNAELSGFGEKDEVAALANLNDAEGLLDDPNLLNNFPDHAQATDVFDAVSKEVQGIGWHFNTRREVAITPDVGDGEIDLPAGTLRAYKSNIAAQVTLDVAHRGTKMYDVENDTLVFVTADLPSNVLKLDLVMELALAELPEVARKYIEIKAARQLQPQSEVEGFTELDEFKALRALQDDQGLIEDTNMLRNMSVARVLHRRTNVFGVGKLGTGSIR